MAHEHNCSCGHDHDHEHHHDHEHEHMDKYHEAFAKFDPAGTEEIVGKHVASILEKHEKRTSPRSPETNPRMHRPDFADQHRHKRKYLETGRPGK